MKELYPAFHLHIISLHGPHYTPGRYHEGAVSCLPLTHYFFSWPTLYPWSLSWRSCILHSTHTLFLCMTHVIPLVAIMKELYPAFHLHIISFHGPRYARVAIMNKLYPAFHLHIIPFHDARHTPGRCHEGAVSCLPLKHYFFSWPTLYTWSLTWRSCTMPSTYNFLFMAHVIHLVAIMKELYPAFHLHIILFHGPRYTPGRYNEGAVPCLPITHYSFSWPTLYPWLLSWRSCILPSTYALFLFMAHVIPLVVIMKELYSAFHIHIISFQGTRYTPGRYHEGAVSCLPLTHNFPLWPTLYPWSLSRRRCILPSPYTIFLFMAHIIPWSLSWYNCILTSTHTFFLSMAQVIPPVRYHDGAVSCLPLTHYFFPWPTLHPWSLSWRSCILHSTYTLLLSMAHVIPWSLSWRSCILPSTYTLFLCMADIIPLVAKM